MHQIPERESYGVEEVGLQTYTIKEAHTCQILYVHEPGALGTEWSSFRGRVVFLDGEFLGTILTLLVIEAIIMSAVASGDRSRLNGDDSQFNCIGW